MLKISDQGQIFLNYVIERYKLYMDMGASVKMANKAVKELYGDPFISKLKEDSYYHGIVFWILEFFQLSYTFAKYPFCSKDTNAHVEPALLTLKDKIMKSKTKVSHLAGSKATKQVY